MKNPLPVDFNENYCRIPNYLVNGHININVNVSVSKLNTLTPEYIYFCLYTDYDQFQKIRLKSTEKFWKNYSGRQRIAQQLGSDGNPSILKNMFNITRSEYVFVDFGTTVDSFNIFQFNVSVFGQILLYPRQSSFVKESCNLSDGQDSRQLSLNLLAHTSEAMCIVGYRQRDRSRSGIPFGKLTIKLTPIKRNKDMMIVFVVVGLVFLLAFCFVQVCLFIHHKSDGVASQGPSSVQR